MQLRTTAITLFLTATSTVFNGCAAQDEVPTLCYDYSDLRFELDSNACKGNVINRHFREVFNAKAAVGERCKGGMKREMMALTGTTTHEGAILTLHDMCVDALAEAAAKVGSANWNVGNVNLNEFFDGAGFLNEETGNFQQEEEDFEKRGGYEKFLSISDDPRLNEHYVTSEESYQAGVAVKNLYDGDSKKKYFNNPTGGFQCESNTVMCCWSRDRQYFDGNGSCKATDCAHENPGDNTDLCWTEENGEVYPYPKDNIENDLHCHGLSWGDDQTGYDVNALSKWNNLFYVSMYDHMYQRGYVEAITSDPKIHGNYAMCDCVEDMPVVARADCTEVIGTASYTVSFDQATKHIKVEANQDSFELEYQACEGYKYVEDFTPEDYAVDQDSRELRSQDNDLSAFVYRQYLEGKLDESQIGKIEETLIGYGNNEINNNDNKRNEACQAAFEKKYPGTIYEARVVEVDDMDV